MERKVFVNYYNGIVIPIAEGICKDNSNFEFTSNLDGVYEEYLKQKALIKLLVKNANGGPGYTLLDRHKIAACLTTAVMKTQLLHPDNIDDANNDYSLLEASRINAQLAFLTGLNRLVQKLQFLNKFRLKTAKCLAFCEACEITNRVIEQAQYYNLLHEGRRPFVKRNIWRF
jgi:hypothetical protein